MPPKAIAHSPFVLAPRPRSQLAGFARDIKESVKYNSLGVLAQIEALSTEITSYALNSNSTWPFVTLPDFNLRVANKNRAGNAEMVIFSPIVKMKQKTAWEAYAISYQGWIAKDMVSGTNESTAP
jgi:hypothetical protein